MRSMIVVTVVGLIAATARAQTTQSAPAAKDDALKVRVVRVTLVRAELRVGDADDDVVELLERENTPEEPRLTMLLAISGKAVAGATQWGHLDVEALDDRGKSLDVQPWSRWGTHENPEAGYVDFEMPSFMRSGRRPDAPPLVPLTFDVPGREAGKVSLHGEFKLRVPERVEVDIPGIGGKPRRVQNEQLKKLNVGLRLLGVAKAGETPAGEPSEEDEEAEGDEPARGGRRQTDTYVEAYGEKTGPTVRFAITADPEQVLKADLVDAEGGQIDSLGMSFRYENRRHTYELRVAELPEDAKLRLVLVRKWREPVVKFDFKNVELP